ADAVFYAHEPVLVDGAIRPRLMAEVGRTVRDGSHEVTVVGGRRVDERLLEAELQDPHASARVVGPGDAVIVPPRGRLTPCPALIRIPLSGPVGAPVGHIEIAVSDAVVEAVLGQVTLLAALLAGGALVVTVLLGLWVARRMTRDLDALVVGAQAAARGALDHQ